MRNLIVYNPTTRHQYYSWLPKPAKVNKKEVATFTITPHNDPRKIRTKRLALTNDINADKARVWFGGIEQTKTTGTSTPKDTPALKRFCHPIHTIPTNSDGTLAVQKVLTGKVDAPLEDTALIMCHYGDDPVRLKATYNAMDWTVKTSPAPINMIMVEATKANETTGMKDYCSKHDITYVERKRTAKNEGMFLKEALWTIGAKEAIKDKGITKLIFLDADASFVHQDWARATANALDTYDVVSPHWCYYYADQPEASMRRTYTSAGYIHSEKIRGRQGFPGLSVGMTKDYFTNQMQSRIPNQVFGIGDSLLWAVMMGNRYTNQHPLVGHTLTPTELNGRYPLAKVGHAGQIIAHHYHGPMTDRSYNGRHYISYTSMPVHGQAMEYDKNDMPVWRDNSKARVARKAFSEVSVQAKQSTVTISTDIIRAIYDKHALEEYGSFTKDNPLVITCLLRSGGEYGPKHVHWLKKQFDRNLLAPFRFVCQSDIDVPGIETIPLTLSIRDAPTWWSQAEHYQNIWGDSSVLTCDLDTVIMRPFTPHQCPVGEFYMLREVHNWAYNQNVTWGGGLTFFRGDMSAIYDKYVEDLDKGGHHTPHYTSIYPQEYILRPLYTLGICPQDIETHFCYRYYQDNNIRVGDEAHFAIFPNRPKPWDLPADHPALPELDPL